MILKASRIHGVESALVRAVIAVESAFNRYARSHKGALGLMQLMPATGRMYGVVNPYDPWQNIRAGTEHLRSLINQFGDIRLALAAYNAGATPVKRYNGIPPYRETRSYVKKVMAIYRAGKQNPDRQRRSRLQHRPARRTGARHEISRTDGSECATARRSCTPEPRRGRAAEPGAARGRGQPASPCRHRGSSPTRKANPASVCQCSLLPLRRPRRCDAHHPDAPLELSLRRARAMSSCQFSPE